MPQLVFNGSRRVATFQQPATVLINEPTQPPGVERDSDTACLLAGVGRADDQKWLSRAGNYADKPSGSTPRNQSIQRQLEARVGIVAVSA